MFPDPVNSFGRFVTQIATVKVTAKKQNKTHVIAVATPQLSHFN